LAHYRITLKKLSLACGTAWRGGRQSRHPDERDENFELSIDN